MRHGASNHKITSQHLTHSSPPSSPLSSPPSSPLSSLLSSPPSYPLLPPLSFPSTDSSNTPTPPTTSSIGDGTGPLPVPVPVPDPRSLGLMSMYASEEMMTVKRLILSCYNRGMQLAVTIRYM